MALNNLSRPVIGPLGDTLTLEDLPTAGSTRWVRRRKAEVVLAVEAGLLSLDDACSRYLLTPDEFSSWQRGLAQHGLRGLRVRSSRTQSTAGKRKTRVDQAQIRPQARRVAGRASHGLRSEHDQNR